MLHAIPPAAIHAAKEHEDWDQRRRANSAIGNGFHLPSIMLVMMLLLHGLQVQAEAVDPPRGFELARSEADLRANIKGTIFEEDFLLRVPGVLKPKEFVDEMAILFSDLVDAVGQGVRLPWVETSKRLKRCYRSVAAMQIYWAYRRCMGMGWNIPRPVLGHTEAEGASIRSYGDAACGIVEHTGIVVPPATRPRARRAHLKEHHDGLPL